MVEKPSLAKRVPSGILGSLVEGLGAPASFAQDVLGLGNKAIKNVTGYENVLPERLSFNIPGTGPLGNYLPKITPPTSQEIRKGFVEPIAQATVGKEALEPGSFPEEIAHSVARGLPTAALTGGLSTVPAAAATIGKDIISSTAMKTAEKFGAPWWGQAIVGLGAAKGADKFINKITKSNLNPQSLMQLAQESKTDFYNTAKGIGSKVKLPAQRLTDRFNHLQETIRKDRSLSDIDRKSLVDSINEFSSDIKGNSLTPDALIARRAQINANVGKTSREAKSYWQALGKDIREEIDTAKRASPEFGKALNAADSIHNAQHFGDFFDRKLEELPYIGKVLKNPLAHAAASIGTSLLFGRDAASAVLHGAFGTAAAAGLKKSYKLAGFLGAQEPQKLLLRASAQMLEGSYKDAARTYARLDKEADKYSKQRESFDKKHIMRKQKSREGYQEVA